MSARGWSVKRFDRSKGRDTAHCKLPLQHNKLPLQHYKLPLQRRPSSTPLFR